MDNRLLCTYNTKGTVTKSKYLSGVDTILVKGNSYNCYESITEVIVSNLLDILGERYIKYWLDGAENYPEFKNSFGDYVSVCNMIQYDDVEKLPLYDYICMELKIEDNELTTGQALNYIVFMNFKIRREIFRTLWVDTIVCNEDRHLMNFDILLGDKQLELFPMFDFGRSIWCNGKEYNKDFKELSKPFRDNHYDQSILISMYEEFRLPMDVYNIYNKWLDLSLDVLRLLPDSIRMNICEGLRYRLNYFRHIEYEPGSIWNF